MKRRFKEKTSDIKEFELLTDELAYKITGGVKATSKIVAGHMYTANYARTLDILNKDL